MGIRQSTDSVRVRVVLTAMEDTGGELTGAVPLGPADARIHDPTRPGSPKCPPKRWETSKQQRECLSEFSDPDLISGSVGVCNRRLI